MKALLEWKNRPTPPTGGVKVANLVEYRVTVHTGSMLCAGTNARVYITIVGDKFTTHRQNLDSWRDDFESGDERTYKFRDGDVGRMELIIVKMERSARGSLLGDSEWFLEKILIEKTGDARVFPHYQWIKVFDPKCEMEDPLIIQDSRTRIPQMEDVLAPCTDHGSTARMLQVLEHKRINKWDYNIRLNNDLVDVSQIVPGFLKVIDYDALDHKFKWFGERWKDYTALKEQLKSSAFSHLYFYHLFDKISYIEEHREVTKAVTGDVISPEDKWLDRWESDVEFGRQTMNGASPVMIKRIKQIPEKFPVTDEDVHSLHLHCGLRDS